MTNEERIELLKAVAECAPKEMGARFHGTYVDFVGPGMDDGDGPPQLGLEDDLCDASACFAMLDAMETPARAEAISRAFVAMFQKQRKPPGVIRGDMSTGARPIA